MGVGHRTPVGGGDSPFYSIVGIVFCGKWQGGLLIWLQYQMQ